MCLLPRRQPRLAATEKGFSLGKVSKSSQARGIRNDRVVVLRWCFYGAMRPKRIA